MCLRGIIYSNFFDSSRLHFRIFPNSTGPPIEDVVGAVSCIIWSLTLIPLIKYCWIVLRAGDDQGEGIANYLFPGTNSNRRDIRLVHAIESISQSR